MKMKLDEALTKFFKMAKRDGCFERAKNEIVNLAWFFNKQGSLSDEQLEMILKNVEDNEGNK